MFELRIIHRRRRTGFEDSKEFPIRKNDLIAGRYQVGGLHGRYVLVLTVTSAGSLGQCIASGCTTRLLPGPKEGVDLRVLGCILLLLLQVMDFLGSAAFSQAVQALDVATGALVCLKIIKNNKVCTCLMSRLTGLSVRSPGWNGVQRGWQLVRTCSLAAATATMHAASCFYCCVGHWCVARVPCGAVL